VAPHPQPQPRFAIGLGCEIRHAARLVYAAGLDLEAHDRSRATPLLWLTATLVAQIKEAPNIENLRLPWFVETTTFFPPDSPSTN